MKVFKEKVKLLKGKREGIQVKKGRGLLTEQ